MALSTSLIVTLIPTLNAQANQSQCTLQSTPAECRAHIEQAQAILIKLTASQFTSVYMDSKNGLLWSKALPGTYTNGCVNSSGEYSYRNCTFETNRDGSPKLVDDGIGEIKISDSLAAQACDKVGGRLPTKSEIESLIRNFDSIEGTRGPRLTLKGRIEMQAKFGENMAKWFWSASFNSSNPATAYYFDGTSGVVGEEFRKYPHAVRCVLGQ